MIPANRVAESDQDIGVRRHHTKWPAPISCSAAAESHYRKVQTQLLRSLLSRRSSCWEPSQSATCPYTITHQTFADKSDRPLFAKQVRAGKVRSLIECCDELAWSYLGLASGNESPHFCGHDDSRSCQYLPSAQVLHS